MKHELFVEQPDLSLLEGVRVTDGLELSYQNGTVEQILRGLSLHTILEQSGTHNGVNTFHSMSHVELNLNEGDILLFDKEKGYYLPPYPVTSIDEAITDIGSLESYPRFKEGFDT